ncbi:hypothetical protein RRG08_050617 [Elysia crispata]|uniref:Uncharacterized protein n=1 Tax=Elysia crispata TaxID=231223 RepID=A0AAE1APQ5_9GAST|nr:hypothetical protein RRG08_050617 [Elysia crispata]
METTADHQCLGEVFSRQETVSCASVVCKRCDSPKPDGASNIDMQKVDGVWYMKFNAVDDMAVHLRELRALHMRHDDVITCGFTTTTTTTTTRTSTTRTITCTTKTTTK